MPGFSREVIKARTYLFLGTCVHPVFLTKCGRVLIRHLGLMSLCIVEEVMFISSARGLPFVVGWHGGCHCHHRRF